MPQLNKSETVRQRLRHLLQRLVDFANHELTDCDHLENKIRIRWIGLETSSPKLIVKTEIRFLAALVSQTVDAKTKEHLKQDLRTLKDFLGRLEDNRDRTQGTGLWHFTLKLWHRSSEKNLIAFDELWHQRKASAPKPAIKKASPLTAPTPVPTTPNPSSTANTPLSATPQTPATNLPLQHNLPARDYGTFIGREQTLAQLATFLKADHPVSRISLTGIGGIGKTALSLEAAHRCLSQRKTASETAPDGENINTFSTLIFVSAKAQRLTPQGILPSYRYSRTLQDIFRAIAQTLKRPDLLAGDFEHQLENTYEMLSWQRTLLILDNLEALSPEDQQAALSFLYELPTTVKAIVTSRTHLTMDAVIPLQALSEPEGLQFIRHQASLKAIALNEPDSRRLYTYTGGVPAAAVYALGQIAAGYPVPTVLPKLTRQASDYCRYYLESTVESLKGQPAYTVLTALSLFPEFAPVSAIVYIAQLTEDTSIESLAKLQQLALVTPATAEGEKSLSMLPLTREYMLTQLSTDSENTIRERWLTWHQEWLHSYRQLNWREWHDYSSIDLFWGNLQAVVEWCIATDRDEAFEQLWDGLRGYTHLRGYWNERLGWLTWWLTIAQQKKDALTTMKALRDIGWTLTLIGQPQQLDTAAHHFSQAWGYRHAADTAFQLNLAIDFAILYLFQNQLAKVQPWLTTADSLLAEATLTPEEKAQQQMRLDYYTAQLHYRQGHYSQAQSLYQALLTRVTKKEQQQAKVYILNWLVDIALQQSDLESAENLLAQSWPIIERKQDKRSHAFHLRSKAQLENLRGNPTDFQHWSQQAKACFENLGMQPQVQEMQAWLADAQK